VVGGTKLVRRCLKRRRTNHQRGTRRGVQPGRRVQGVPPPRQGTGGPCLMAQGRGPRLGSPGRGGPRPTLEWAKMTAGDAGRVQIQLRRGLGSEWRKD